MHEGLLVGLSAADDRERVRALELLVQEVAKEEPEQGEIDACHPIMEKLRFMINDRYPVMRKVKPLLLSILLALL